MRMSTRILAVCLALGALVPQVTEAQGRDGGGFLGGALGLGTYTFNEEDDFGPASIRGEGGGAAAAWQVMAGAYSRQVAFYATYIGTSFSTDKPSEDGSDVKKSLDLIGGGMNLFLTQDSVRTHMLPYLVLGGGFLFHAEEGVYQGRGPGFFGGLGIRFAPHIGFETRFMGGAASEKERSFGLSSLQMMFVLSTY